jgi:hypothetical protein
MPALAIAPMAGWTDVVAERQRDPGVPEVLGDHRHRVGLGQVRRHQPVEVRVDDVVELGLSRHAEHHGLVLVDDRDDRGGLVRGAADDHLDVVVGGEQAADRRDRVGRLAPGVHREAGQLVAEHAAGLVDGLGRAGAGDEVRRSERRVHAAERGDVGDGE